MTETAHRDREDCDWYGVPRGSNLPLWDAVLQLEVLRNAEPITNVSLWSLGRMRSHNMQLVWPLHGSDSVMVRLERRGEVRPGWELIQFTLGFNSYRVGPFAVPALVWMRPSQAPSALVHFPSQHTGPVMRDGKPDPDPLIRGVFSVAVTCTSSQP